MAGALCGRVAGARVKRNNLYRVASGGGRTNHPALLGGGRGVGCEGDRVAWVSKSMEWRRNRAADAKTLGFSAGSDGSLGGANT